MNEQKTFVPEPEATPGALRLPESDDSNTQSRQSATSSSKQSTQHDKHQTQTQTQIPRHLQEPQSEKLEQHQYRLDQRQLPATKLQQPNQTPSFTQQSSLHPLQENTHEPSDPLRQLAANPKDSLFRYVNLDDPTRFIGSYASIVTVITAIHFIPFTQYALKFGATILGGVAAVEFANRQFTPNTVLSSVRPQQYRGIPEDKLNAALKDVHDVVQFLAVHTQRIVLGHDVENTFFAFLGVTALFWLRKIIPVFGIAILAVTGLYAIPLVNSARGRQAVQDVAARTQQATVTAVQNTQQLAHTGSAKASELANATVQNTQQLAQTGSAKVSELANATMQNTQQLAQSGSAKASELTNAAVQNTQQLAQNGQAKAAELTSAAQNSAASAAQGTKERLGLAQSGETAPNLTKLASEKLENTTGSSTSKSAPQKTSQAPAEAATHTVHSSLGRVDPSTGTTASVSGKKMQPVIPPAIDGRRLSASGGNAVHSSSNFTSSTGATTSFRDAAAEGQYKLGPVVNEDFGTAGSSSVPRQLRVEKQEPVHNVKTSAASQPAQLAARNALDRPSGVTTAKPRQV